MKFNFYNTGNDYMSTFVRKQTNVNKSPSDMFVVVYDKEVDPIVFTTDKPVFVKYQNYLITLANRDNDSLTFQQITGNETDGYRFIQILYKDGVWSVPQDREITFDEAKEYIKETADVIITPNVKKQGGLSLTSEGSANIDEKVGLSFDIAHVELKQEPWNNTEEKVGLSFELSYLNLYREYEPITTETGDVLTTENNESIDVLLK